MDLRGNPRAAGLARQIEARTGFDVLDEAKVAQAIALCQARRASARRAAVVSGALAAAVVIAWTAAAAAGVLHGYEYVLGPALLLLNGVRLATALRAAGRLARIVRSIGAARAEVEAAAAWPPPPPPGTAAWN